MLICVGVISEVTLRIYLTGTHKFFRSKVNILDLFVTFLCVMAIGIAYTRMGGEIEGEVVFDGN